MVDESSNHPTSIAKKDEGRWLIRYWSEAKTSRIWVILFFIMVGIFCLSIIPNYTMVLNSGIWGLVPLSIILAFLGYMAFLVSPLRPMLIDWDGEYLSFRGLYPFGIHNIFPENFHISHLQDWILDDNAEHLILKIYHPALDSNGNFGYSSWHFLPLDGIRSEDKRFLIRWLNNTLPNDIQTF